MMNKYLLSTSARASFKSHLIFSRSGAPATSISYQPLPFSTSHSIRHAHTLKPHQPQNTPTYESNTTSLSTPSVIDQPQHFSTQFSSTADIIRFTQTHIRHQRLSPSNRSTTQLGQFDSLIPSQQQFFSNSPSLSTPLPTAAPALSISNLLLQRMTAQQQQFFASRSSTLITPSRHINSAIADIDPLAVDEGIQFTSVLRKRRTMMNRHKLKKRRKRERFITRKSTKE